VSDTLFLAFQEALLGRFSLEREIGRGGMGIVYRAREVALDRLVAIKLLPPDLARDPSRRDRFLREARTAAQLSQPNIVPIYAVDEASGFVFFVMAFVDGETLAERVATAGRLPADEVVRILRELAWALAHAHSHGVVHRDLKPANIMLERDTGRPVLMDFGIAARFQAAGAAGAGQLIGTPEFMSPEQARGEAVDGRSDLYSLGVVGHFLVTGRVPFDGRDAAAVLAKQLHQPAPSLAGLAPRALQQALARCLAKSPSDRFADARALSEALAMAVEVRREAPPELRAFIRQSLELGTTGCLYLFAVMYVAPMLVVWSLPSAWALPGFALAYLTGWIVVPLVLHVRRVRRLLAAGFRHQDVIDAIKDEIARRREEIAVTIGPAPTGLERLLLKSRYAGLFVAGATAAVGIAGFGAFTVASPFLTLVGGLGLATAIGGFVAARRRRDVVGEQRLWYWRGLGRWAFKLASIFQKESAPRGLPPHHATELAIARAAEALFDQLPPEVRKSLGDVPQVAADLEQQAARVRQRIDQLDDALALQQAPEPAARRAELVEQLTGAREVAQQRLKEVVTALETLRLDLMRLRLGAGGADRVTADLSAAAAIGERVTRLLEGHAELDRDLR
jgi:serine/threonine-protein kinase